MHQKTVSSILPGILFALALAALGVLHLVKPDQLTRRLRRGGEMLTDWNETRIQLVGVILILVAGLLVYGLLHSES